MYYILITYVYKMNVRQLIINTISDSGINPVNRPFHNEAVRRLRLLDRDNGRNIVWVRPNIDEHSRYYIPNNMETFIEELDTYIQRVENTEVKEVTRIKEFTAEGVIGECAICQETIKKGDKFTRTACTDIVNHCYHTDCCSQWFKDNSTCPICRAELSKTDA